MTAHQQNRRDSGFQLEVGLLEGSQTRASHRGQPPTIRLPAQVA